MLAIIQARMTSSRLPGKMMMHLVNRPLLAWVCDRVGQSSAVKKMLVVTSNTPSDDPIEEFCRLNHVPCYRGSLENVAERFLAAVEREDASSFIRICGDSPFIDPRLIDYGVDQFKRGSYDLVTNVLKRSFPKGQSVEVVSTDAFRGIFSKTTSADYREHVTKYFYAHDCDFRIKNFSSDYNTGHVQLSVDTIEDFQLAEKILNLSNGNPGGWLELVALENACR